MRWDSDRDAWLHTCPRCSGPSAEYHAAFKRWSCICGYCSDPRYDQSSGPKFRDGYRTCRRGVGYPRLTPDLEASYYHDPRELDDLIHLYCIRQTALWLKHSAHFARPLVAERIIALVGRAAAEQLFAALRLRGSVDRENPDADIRYQLSEEARQA